MHQDTYNIRSHCAVVSDKHSRGHVSKSRGGELTTSEEVPSRTIHQYVGGSLDPDGSHLPVNIHASGQAGILYVICQVHAAEIARDVLHSNTFIFCSNAAVYSEGLFKVRLHPFKSGHIAAEGELRPVIYVWLHLHTTLDVRQ